MPVAKQLKANLLTSSEIESPIIFSEVATITLSADDWEVLVKSLDSVGTPRPKLAAAMRKYREWQRK